MPSWNDSNANLPDREAALRADAQGGSVPGGGNSGQVLTKNSSSSGDVSWKTPSVSGLQITQSSHGFSVGQALAYNGTAYVLAKADVAADAEVIGIVSAVADSNNFTLTLTGLITGLSALTAGAVYFLDPSTAGALTTTEPTSVGAVSKPVLIAISTTSGVFVNMRGIAVPSGGGIPQGGPLTANLAGGSFKITGLTGGSASGEAVEAGQIVSNSTGGLPNGALAATFSRTITGITAFQITSGTLHLTGIELCKGVPINSITFMTASGAATNPTHQIFGIFDDSLGSSSGTGYALLRGSSDDTSTAWGAITAKTLSLTSSYTPVRSGFHYLGLLVTAGVAPTMKSLATDSAMGGIASIVAGSSSSTGLTALPNPAGAPSFNNALWGYVS